MLRELLHALVKARLVVVALKLAGGLLELVGLAVANGWFGHGSLLAFSLGIIQTPGVIILPVPNDVEAPDSPAAVLCYPSPD